MSTARRLVGNTAANAAAQAIQVVSAVVFMPFLMFLVLNTDSSPFSPSFLCTLSFFSLLSLTNFLCVSPYHQCMFILGFDIHIFDTDARDFSLEIIVSRIFVKVEAWNEAIHEAVTTGEVSIKFINVI